MKPELSLCLVQGDTRWHDPSANRDYYGQLIASQKVSSDIFILPETFTSGFSNEALASAETMEGDTRAWMLEQAQKHQAVITGSVQIREGVKVFNRMLWAQPDGQCFQYDKRHLFRMANEHQRYAAGKNRLTLEYLGWRICPLVCYDLRFPVFSRNQHNKQSPNRFDYDLLIYVANWPSVRRHAWNTLLPARAVENLAYVAGVNRVGCDGNNIDYSGDSQVYDFLGQAMIDTRQSDSESCFRVQLSAEALQTYREKFPAYLDADRFELMQ
jgi:omega-amidase